MSQQAKDGMVFWNKPGIVNVHGRDRIYASLNLITPSYRSGFEAFCSKSTSEVYTEVLIHDLNMTQAMVILSQCEFGETKVRELSSWVPGFSRPRICEVLWDFSS